MSTGTKKKEKTTVNVGPNFIYQYVATETQIHDNRDVAVFFLMNDLRPGTSMKLHFARTSPVTAFLPRSLAKILPFSLKKLPEILSVFSIRSNSVEAEALKKTLREAEASACRGELIWGPINAVDEKKWEENIREWREEMSSSHLLMNQFANLVPDVTT